MCKMRYTRKWLPFCLPYSGIRKLGMFVFSFLPEIPLVNPDYWMFAQISTRELNPTV